jgi:hypothetical protein
MPHETPQAALHQFRVKSLCYSGAGGAIPAQAQFVGSGAHRRDAKRDVLLDRYT